MERDFLGFTSKHGASTTNDPAPAGMQWSFSNKVSAVPQLLSFKASQEDSRTRKNTNNSNNIDSIASSGYHNMTISTAAVAAAAATNNILGVSKTMGGNKHGMFSVSNKVANAGKPHSHHGGLSLIAPPPSSLLPSKLSIVGTTELRNSSKSSAKPAQLTIFYAGSVCVYEDISPEKAQAIMLLAGNGSTPIQSKSVPAANTCTTSKLDDGFIITQSYHPSPIIPSPLPMTFHNNNELAMMRPLASSSSAPNHTHLDSPKLVASAKSAAPKMAPPAVGLPQARKASLARFLEKRKERVTNTSPYYMNKKSSLEDSSVGSDGISFSINSTTCCALPAIN